jgi:hypothetical protein
MTNREQFMVDLLALKRRLQDEVPRRHWEEYDRLKGAILTTRRHMQQAWREYEPMSYAQIGAKVAADLTRLSGRSESADFILSGLGLSDSTT